MKRLFVPIALLAITFPALVHSQKHESDKGEQVYQQLCAGCHGVDGRAQTETAHRVGAADLTSAVVQDQSDSQLSKVIKEGRGKMPPWSGKLDDSDIRAVVAYIRQFRAAK